MSSENKIALILPGSIWYAPYVRNYTRILDSNNTEYAIISWNREGDDQPEGFQYNVRSDRGHGSARLSSYKGYIDFIKRTVREQKFNRLIIFGPQLTCLLSTYLLSHFRHRYLIDYRDLSIEQKIVFKQLFSLLLKYSCANVISSPGFKRCLPKSEYYISHNFNVHAVKEALDMGCEDTKFNIDSGIDVLTIGAIRDFSSNIEVTKALANKKGFTLRFVGRGKDAIVRLKAYCKEVKADNIFFVDSYNKPEEAGYVKSSTFMNIFYPRVITHDTALSNRFYNSLIYRKPMIVTKDTCQGYYAEKYRVGLALSDCSNLTNDLQGFVNENYLDYVKRCNALLREFMKDQELFEKAVVNFITAQDIL